MYVCIESLKSIIEIQPVGIDSTGSSRISNTICIAANINADESMNFGVTKYDDEMLLLNFGHLVEVKLTKYNN